MLALAFLSCRVEPANLDHTNTDQSADSTGLLQNDLVLVGGNGQNVGQLKKNETYTHRFKIRNLGNRAYTITDIKTSCGCLGAKVVGNARFEPGDEAQIDITVNGSQRKAGANNSMSAAVRFADREPFLIQFNYDTVWDVFAEPEKIGPRTYYEHEKVTGTIVFRQKDGLPITIQNWETQSGAVEVSHTERVGSSTVLHFRLKSDAVGEYQDALTINTSARIDKVITVPVEWTIAPDIRLDPQSIFWGSVSPGETYSRELTLTTRDGNALEIISVESDQELYTVELLEQDDRSKLYRITLSLETASTSTAAGSPIEFHTNKGKIILPTFFSVL